MEKRETIAEQLHRNALERRPEKRSAFLDAACRGMPEVRRTLEDMLAEDAGLTGFFSASPWRPADTSERGV